MPYFLLQESQAESIAWPDYTSCHAIRPDIFEKLRFFIISSYVTITNARAVGLVLTVLNHFHLFPSGPLAQIAEGARRGHLLCSCRGPTLLPRAELGVLGLFR